MTLPFSLSFSLSPPPQSGRPIVFPLFTSGGAEEGKEEGRGAEEKEEGGGGGEREVGIEGEGEREKEGEGEGVVEEKRGLERERGFLLGLIPNWGEEEKKEGEEGEKGEGEEGTVVVVVGEGEVGRGGGRLEGKIKKDMGRESLLSFLLFSYGPEEEEGREEEGREGERRVVGGGVTEEEEEEEEREGERKVLVLEVEIFVVREKRSGRGMGEK